MVILIRNALYEVLCTGLFYKNDFSAFCIDIPSYVVGFVIIAVNIYKCVSCFAASPKFSLLIFFIFGNDDYVIGNVRSKYTLVVFYMPAAVFIIGVDVVKDLFVLYIGRIFKYKIRNRVFIIGRKNIF